MKLRNLIFTLTALVIVFSSCDKEIIEPEETLDNAYIQSVSIINIPPNDWDIGTDPDLKLFLAKENSETWTYATNQVNNVDEVPYELFFETEVPITDENWILKLIDEDDSSPDDEIYKITFNPYHEFKDGYIPVYYNDLEVVKFYYTKK